MAESVKIRFPADLKFLELALDFGEGIGRAQGMKTELPAIRLGLEEALVNVISHGCPEDDAVELSANAGPLGIEFLIHERGIPFDSEALERQLVASAEGAPEHGLGLRLMKSFMDEVSFKSLGMQGKETRLFKRFAREQQQEPDVELMVEEPPAPKEKIEYTIRPMQPNEAVEVARCAYSSYGYTFLNANIYDPTYIREMNASGILVSLVAVSEGGVVMGHAAMRLEDEDPLCGGWGYAFVRKKYQRQGCLGRLSTGLLKEAQDRKLQWIFVDAVCTHTYSQRASDPYGFSPSAIVLARATPMDFKGIDEERRRVDLLLCFKRIAAPDKRLPLFLPAHHEDKMREIYQGLDESVECKAIPDDCALPGQPFSVNVVADTMSAVRMVVEEYGTGVVEEVRSSLKAACLDGAEVVYLLLDLSLPQTAWLVETFEEMGFFFSGIWPRSDGHDQFILQYLNSIAVDFDAMQIASEQGNKLKDYVQKCEAKAVKPWS